MSVFDDLRRWAKDRFSPHDENINGTPRHWMREAHESFPQVSQTERQRTLEHLRAYATYYYKDQVPAEVRQELTTMESTAKRLNAVDQARAVLEKYGGPPSRETIAESLERSMKERENARERIQPEAQRESVQERAGREEMEYEARHERQGLHINQYNARNESPANASEHVQNQFADDAERAIQKQMRALDRQFPNATEVEKLQITENKLGLDHSVSERLVKEYGYQVEPVQQRESTGYRVRM